MKKTKYLLSTLLTSLALLSLNASELAPSLALLNLNTPELEEKSACAKEEGLWPAQFLCNRLGPELSQIITAYLVRDLDTSSSVCLLPQRICWEANGIATHLMLYENNEQRSWLILQKIVSLGTDNLKQLMRPFKTERNSLSKEQQAYLDPILDKENLNPVHYRFAIEADISQLPSDDFSRDLYIKLILPGLLKLPIQSLPNRATTRLAQAIKISCTASLSCRILKSQALCQLLQDAYTKTDKELCIVLSQVITLFHMNSAALEGLGQDFPDPIPAEMIAPGKLKREMIQNLQEQIDLARKNLDQYLNSPLRQLLEKSKVGNNLILML